MLGTHDIIAHGNKEIKEQLSALFHLHLHGAAPFEGRPTADDQGEVVRPQLRVGVRGVSVRVTGAGEDGAALDTGLQALFTESQAFERGEVVAFCCTTICFQQSAKISIIKIEFLWNNLLNSSILQNNIPRGLVHDRRIVLLRAINVHITRFVFQLPRVSTPVVQQPRVVVALVQVLEHAGEDFGLLLRKADGLAMSVGGFEKLSAAGIGEDRGHAEDFLMGGEEALFGSHADGDDGGGEGSRQNGMLVDVFSMDVSSLVMKETFTVHWVLPLVWFPVLFVVNHRDVPETSASCCGSLTCRLDIWH